MEVGEEAERKSRVEPGIEVVGARGGGRGVEWSRGWR